MKNAFRFAFPRCSALLFLGAEEYHRYGSTAFHTAASGAEVSAKRYRYTSKEKDEETGLYYHGARYYAPWLGRWTAADPAGLVDGLNLYRYSRDNPINFSDPGGTESSNFERLLGGLKTVGGILETAAGVGLTLAGVATSEVGVGIPVAVAGAAVTAHGIDTTVSGLRTLISGERKDTLTSQGLQAAGVERNAANLVDAGISVAGTLGAGAAVRAPAAAGGEVAVSFSPGLPGVTPGTVPGTIQHFDPVNKFSVITDAASGRVITVF